MKVAVLFVSLLVIPPLATHDASRIQALRRNFNARIIRLINTIDEVREDYDDEIAFIREDTIAELKNKILPSLLPEMIRGSLRDFVKTGELEQLFKDTEMGDTNVMKKTTRQLKSRLSKLASATSRIERERRDYRKFVKEYETELRRLKQQVNSCESRIQSLENTNRHVTVKHPKTEIRRSCEDLDDHTGCKQSKRKRASPITTTSSTTITTTTTTTTKGTIRKAKEESTSIYHSHNLLLAPFRGAQFFQLDLSSNTMQRHPLVSKDLLDVIYNPKTQRIIWSNETSVGRPNPGVYSAMVDGNDVRLMTTAVGAWSLALDTNRNLLFCGKLLPDMGIDVIKMDAYFVQWTIPLYFNPSYLSLHTDRQIILVTRWDGIVKLDYNGVSKKVFLKGSDISSITTDEASDVLYYFDVGVIMQYSFKTSKTRHLWVRTETVVRLVYFRDLLYIALQNRNSEVMDLKTNATTRIGTGFGLYRPLVCFIPK